MKIEILILYYYYTYKINIISLVNLLNILQNFIIYELILLVKIEHCILVQTTNLKIYLLINNDKKIMIIEASFSLLF